MASSPGTQPPSDRIGRVARLGTLLSVLWGASVEVINMLFVAMMSVAAAREVQMLTLSSRYKGERKRGQH